LALTGRGKVPLTGGPAGTLKACIAETMSFDYAVSNSSISTGVMTLTPIYLCQGQTITSINYVSCSTAESGGSHLWFALYDDGRGSTTAGQLSLLGQTPDQTAAAAFAANTNLGLALNIPYLTTYTGIYYLAIMCVGTTPSISGLSRSSLASIQIGSSTGSLLGATAGSGLTSQAPSPSGALTYTLTSLYAYVS
jgi:hypothetical protein